MKKIYNIHTWTSVWRLGSTVVCTFSNDSSSCSGLMVTSSSVSDGICTKKSILYISMLRTRFLCYCQRIFDFDSVRHLNFVLVLFNDLVMLRRTFWNHRCWIFIKLFYTRDCCLKSWKCNYKICFNSLK